MNVLILSTYAATGGAAIAANRLLHALRHNGINADMLCRRDISWWPSHLKPQSYTSIWERFVIWCHNSLSRDNLWAWDIARYGQDITKTKAFREADVIHLHWINQGFLSLHTIEKIINSGKRIVWTMHDEWPLEGIEHYTLEHLPMNHCVRKLNESVLKEKAHVYSQGHITFVTCSEWLRKIAKEKPLGANQEITSIPNPIDTQLFHPEDRKSLRDEFRLPTNKKIVLFVSQNVNDIRKGISYLNEAATLLNDDTMIVALGRDIPYIHDIKKMARLYATCDCFVTPSLQDNLPNTIMEAMSCGTPCVGFNVGGIPEMIDHLTNGYIAEYRNASDLAQGIRYVLDDNNHHRLSIAARQKVESCYSEQIISKQYLEVYENYH